MSLDLHHVTLCAVDCVTQDLAGRALNLSNQQIEFGGALLFSDVCPPGDRSYDFIKIERTKSIQEYSHFVLLELDRHVSTDFILIVQWDGYVLHPHCWRREFTEIDYVGATWPWHQDGLMVGNGGFSLRSKRLAEAFRNIPHPNLSSNEDELLCRVHRRTLESEFGMRYASPELASLFSYERGLPAAPTFGFHGLFNMWRHTDDSEMLRLLTQFGVRTVLSVEFFELMATYFIQQKFSLFLAFYTRCRSQFPDAISMANHLKRFLNNPALLETMLRLGETSQSAV